MMWTPRRLSRVCAYELSPAQGQMGRARAREPDGTMPRAGDRAFELAKYN